MDIQIEVQFFVYNPGVLEYSYLMVSNSKITTETLREIQELVTSRVSHEIRNQLARYMVKNPGDPAMTDAVDSVLETIEARNAGLIGSFVKKMITQAFHFED